MDAIAKTCPPVPEKRKTIDLYLMCKTINKTDSSCVSAWPAVAPVAPHFSEEFAVVLSV
jgi:hypothetical protein